MHRAKCLSLCLTLFISLVLHGRNAPELTQVGDRVILKNHEVRLEFDLSSGTYAVFKQCEARPVLAGARVKVNQWTSDSGQFTPSWSQRVLSDPLGKGLALDISFKADHAPELLVSFVLYEDQNFFASSAGIHNTTGDSVRVKEIYVAADAAVYGDYDISHDFAMIDGFSGGEPLEYGERFYSPLTRANALKSRNNIFLTFTEDEVRHQLVMGGLSYQDYEKFAWIEQARRSELSFGIDGQNSLLAYLDLPNDRKDASASGETLALIKGTALRQWENHEFRCSEMATSVKAPGQIIFEAKNLKQERPYTLGFSWWQGMRHGDHQDLTQSVFVEFQKDGKSWRLPLVENRALPRFDGKSKEDVAQVELPLPADAIAAGGFRIVVEKAADTGEEDPNVYLSEVWLRDGRHQALLPAELTPVAESPRPRRSYTGQLFAADPVGKRVDPGQRYLAPDRFYLDVTGDDPFSALESYAQRVRQAQNIELSMYDFPTVCLWYAADNRYGGKEGDGANNTSLGAVEEARAIAASGFLNYSRAAVRLVPDSYMPNNHQGWWDDKHWQREDTDRDTTQNGRYVEPYETTEKWGRAVTDAGVIPLTYFQTAYRSEDYAEMFPGHMLFNQRYAWKGEPVDTEGEMFTTWEKTWTRNGRVVWGYDFTDPDFLDHLQNVYANLKRGGVKGLMFDYPASGWASAGGMENDISTTAAAYRTIFRLPHEILGPESYVHERNMERGTDVSLGVVASMRTENDTDSFDGTTATRCGLRWYKNRVLVNFDTDSKNLLELEDKRDHLRAVLTMCYVTSARLLLANSFTQFSPETFRDLTRTFPYHRTPKSARPVDAFVSEMPMVYDYAVNPDWHQVTLFNPDKENPKLVGIDLSGPQVEGSLGLAPEKEYHLFDFWNHRYLGKLKGDARLEQELRPGEARMLSVRACQGRPQVLSTDRHLMQGYLDMREVNWDATTKTLSGISQVVGGDPYRMTLALNGYTPLKIETTNEMVQPLLANKAEGLVEFSLEAPENTEVAWSVSFKTEGIRLQHEVKKIEGWTVHVDVSLLQGEHQEMGALALRLLEQRLHDIVLKLPKEPVARMREVPIFLDRNHPMGNNHYHPGKDWLVERGYDPALTKAVQITHARTLINEAKDPNNSSVMLHELAHAYHDQVLGFEHPEILQAYQEFCDSRKFDRVAHSSGRQMPHYGLTDHKEYFAEMTETFFVGNDYYPFNHYQLYQKHRPSYELMVKIWGSNRRAPKIDHFRTPSILDLRIMANLKSQRGEFDEALEIIEQAQSRSADSEGRLADLKELIERRRDETDSNRVAPE